MNPAELTPEDIEANPELGEAIVQATTAEHTLVCMIFDELGAWDEDGTDVHYDRFEFAGRDWFILHNDSADWVEPAGYDVPPGKTRLAVDGKNVAKMHEDETAWLYDPDSGDQLSGLSVHHQFAAGNEDGHIAAKTWLLRTVDALRWRVADAGGYDIDELAPVETILDDSANRLQEVGE